MKKNTVDLITYDTKTDEYVLHLTENDYRSKEDAVHENQLPKIQDRIFDTIDTVIDGHLMEKYFETFNKKIRIQIDLKSAPDPHLTELIAQIKNHLKKDEYKNAIEQSKFIKDLQVVTNNQAVRDYLDA